MREILGVSGLAIARLIRAGKITSRDAVEIHIAQIERVNPSINAVVAERFDAARREADAADRAPSRLSLLHGVPCTVKECFAVTGMPNTAGLVRRRDVRATGDATVVERIRAAGAIPLGVTNTSELCMWMESTNRVHGRTNNPYDLTRTVGGSSGGEAAIVAAGGSPFGVGSDIGGSIRGPAFFNGVFGHKPTSGLVPATGQIPEISDAAHAILTTGPIARRAEDLMPLLRIMAGPDGHDPACRAMALGDPADVVLRGMKLVQVEDSGGLAVSDDLRDAQERAVRALEQSGMVVERARFPELREQFEIWSAIMSDAHRIPFATMLGEGTRIHPWRELARWMFGRSDHTGMSLVLAITDPIPALMPRYQQRLLERARRLRASMIERIGPRGVMLYPTYTTVAPRHHVPFVQALVLRYPFAHQGIMNVVGVPATQVPLGLDARGLPLGCQVIATHGNDHVSIGVALELERRFGGWTPPALAEIDAGRDLASIAEPAVAGDSV